MFYTYLLESEKGDFYAGFTANLRKRIAEHNQGRNVSTKRRSWRCIYYEACTDEEDARRRERYFKTTDGRRALRTRLKVYLYKSGASRNHTDGV